MTMRREHPALLNVEDRPAAEKVAAAVMDPSEFLWSIRNEPRFNTNFQSTPGERVAYHAPCHLRAQAGGFKRCCLKSGCYDGANRAYYF